MLDEAANRRLTEVGAGTPMGELLRRYWHPVAAVSELEDRPVKAVRLLGEDFALYRDRGGNYGLLERHCAHRRADLSCGFVEDRGLRCHYHGWRYDEAGRCIEQPYEDAVDPGSSYKERVRLKACPVRALGGLVWAYLGPEPAPLVPNWEPFTWKNGFVQIVFTVVPCNWFQCQENSVDPVHFEWTHDNWSVRLRGETGPYAPRHLRLGFEEFEYGILYRRIREGADESHPLWSTGRVCLWPNALFTGNHLEWRVPMDDTTTLSVGWFFSRVPTDREPYVQGRIPWWSAPATDADTGEWITSHIMNQDFVAWVGQGAVADRTREHLGRSDRGIVMMRQRFLADLERIAMGGDPKAVIRDPASNACIELPVVGREAFIRGLTREQWRKLDPAVMGGAARRDFAWLAGQPEEVRAAFEEAMGWK